MKPIKVREITADESKLSEMMAANMKRLPPTSSNLETVTVRFEPEVQP